MAMYLGALESLMRHVTALIAPGGLFLFSVEEAAPGSDFTLLPSLRYAHSASYVKRLLTGAGLSLKAERKTVLRKDAGEPVPGLLFLAGV
nr:hypothetical protein [Marinicella sp. W31]MDC2879109.1 hypothetical protein [Marinicella sp. W31]